MFIAGLFTQCIFRATSGSFCGAENSRIFIRLIHENAWNRKISGVFLIISDRVRFGKSSFCWFEHQIVYLVLSFRNRSVWYSINKASRRSSFWAVPWCSSLFTVTQLLLQLKPLCDPTQPCCIFFNVVHLRDFRRGVSQQIRDLPRRQWFDRTVWLLDAVH